MTGAEIVAAIIAILVSGITGIAQGVGQGLSTLVKELMFYTPTSGTETLSVFAVAVFVFAGISLAFGLCRWVLNFITSLGNRNR